MKYTSLVFFLLLHSISFSQEWELLDSVSFRQEDGAICSVLNIKTKKRLKQPFQDSSNPEASYWYPPDNMQFVVLKIKLNNTSNVTYDAFIFGIKLFDSQTGETHEVEFPGRKAIGGQLKLHPGTKTTQLVYYYPVNGAPPKISCNGSLIKFLK